MTDVVVIVVAAVAVNEHIVIKAVQLGNDHADVAERNLSDEANISQVRLDDLSSLDLFRSLRTVGHNRSDRDTGSNLLLGEAGIKQILV